MTILSNTFLNVTGSTTKLEAFTVDLTNPFQYYEIIFSSVTSIEESNILTSDVKVSHADTLVLLKGPSNYSGSNFIKFFLVSIESIFITRYIKYTKLSELLLQLFSVFIILKLIFKSISGILEDFLYRKHLIKELKEALISKILIDPNQKLPEESTDFKATEDKINLHYSFCAYLRSTYLSFLFKKSEIDTEIDNLLSIENISPQPRLTELKMIELVSQPQLNNFVN